MNVASRVPLALGITLGAASLVFLVACDRRQTPAAPNQPPPPPQLSEKQIKAWQASAEQGDALDKYNLGKMYRDGEGMPKDLAEAAKWFRKSADAGYAKAQYHLALACLDGEGVKPDAAEAAKWLIKAADQGFAKAQEQLGYLYWKGEGVTTNYLEAHKWLSLAAAQGEGKAAKGLKKIELTMSPQQVADAKKAAAAFVPRKTFKKPDNK
jgi:TPR repeat protein